MRREILAATVVAVLAGCGGGLPEVKMERLTPKPMKVAVTGFSVNRFYQVETAGGPGKDSVIPVTNVESLYTTFRAPLAAQTSSRFALVDDATVKGNPAYQAMLTKSTGGQILEQMAAATPSGMVLGRPQDTESSQLCQALGVDGVLWVSGTLTQVPGAFSIGGLGNFALQWHGSLALIGKDGIVWRDEVTLKSDKTFAAISGLASPTSLQEASAELAPKMALTMTERLNKKAGP